MSASDLLYCRFCAEQKLSADITYLLHDLNIQQEIYEKLSCFPSNSIDFGLKSLPETICSLCYFSLSSSYEFFSKIKTSQAVLTNLFSTSFKQEIDVQNIPKHLSVPSNTAIKIENTKNVEINTSFIDYGNDFQTLDEEIEHDSKSNFVTLSGVSWSDYNCICKYCNMTFLNIDTLRAHCKENHAFCNGFKCTDCELDLDDFTCFIRHAREHRDSLKYYCEYCNIKLENNKHTDTHTSNPYCQLCGETFSKKSTLQRHLKSYRWVRRNSKKMLVEELLSHSGISLDDVVVESWADYPWLCRYCGTKVTDQVQLRHHSKEVHGKCGGVSCVDCGYSTGGYEEFVEHVVEHRPGLTSYCPHCNHKYDNDKISHLATHQLHCTICGETFTDQASLDKHNSIYNSAKSKKKRKRRALTQKDLTCSVCQKIAKSSNNLRDHLKLHTERTRDFFCDRCGMSFYTKGALKAHILIHDNPDPQVCKICQKSFINLSRLRKHVLTHSKERPFECGSCYRRFRSKTLLKSHMATHLDVMPFKCQYCSKTFRFKNVLRVHERQHTGSKPYSCEICKMEFFNWSNCDKHLRRKHGMTLAKSKMTPEGKVPLNPKSFKPRSLELQDVKEWTEQVLVPRKRGKKVTSADCMRNEDT